VASKGSLVVHLRGLAVPAQQAMHGEGSAQVVQVRRAVVAALLAGFGAVNAQTIEHVSKIVADPIAVIRFPLRQREEKRAAGRRSPQIGAQAQQVFQIGSGLGSDRNQAILMEFRGPDKERALFGRIIRDGQVPALADVTAGSR